MTDSPPIHPDQVFTVQTARTRLGLPKHTLPREIRLGRLRVARRAGRYFILGAWLLEWLRGGEITRRPRVQHPDASDVVEMSVTAN